MLILSFYPQLLPYGLRSFYVPIFLVQWLDAHYAPAPTMLYVMVNTLRQEGFSYRQFLLNLEAVTLAT